MIIFDNILFHNVEELEKTESGMKFWRLPSPVRAQLSENLRTNTARFGTGIELRFKLQEDKAVIHLVAEPGEEADTCFIYYGSIQGGWQYSSKVIRTEDTAITVVRPANLDRLKEITKEQHLPFDPEVVRIVLPYGNIYYLGHEGAIVPPEKEDLPEKTYLAYGSSITHGSLALGGPHTYAFQIGRRLKYDYLNKGFAGTALAEEAMARWIHENKDWDVASFELGVNMMGMTEEAFQSNIHGFMTVLREDPRPMFFTSIFWENGPDPEKTENFRRIVREEYAKVLSDCRNAHFTEGTELLGEAAFISQDLVHPSLEGAWAIGERWHAVMEAAIGRT